MEIPVVGIPLMDMKTKMIWRNDKGHNSCGESQLVFFSKVDKPCKSRSESLLHIREGFAKLFLTLFPILHIQIGNYSTQIIIISYEPWLPAIDDAVCHLAIELTTMSWSEQVNGVLPVIVQKNNPDLQCQTHPKKHAGQVEEHHLK